MSNRSKWAHWKQPKPERHSLLKRLSIGIAFVGPGVLLVLAGMQGIRDHFAGLWYFNQKYGSVVAIPPTGLIVFGVAFILIGIAIFAIRD